MNTQLAEDLRALLRQHKPSGALCRYQLKKDHVQLDQLRLPQHQRGKGTPFMAQFLAICDAHEQEVRICADPTDEPDDPSTSDLVRWYRRFGWTPTRADDNGVWMTRAPQGNSFEGILASYEKAKVADWSDAEFSKWIHQARVASGCEVSTPRSRPAP